MALKDCYFLSPKRPKLSLFTNFDLNGSFFKITLLTIENSKTLGNSYISEYFLRYISEFMSYIYWLNTINIASASNKFSEFFLPGAFFFHPLTTNTDIFIQEIVLLKDSVYYYLLLSTTESWSYEKCLVWFRQKP